LKLIKDSARSRRAIYTKFWAKLRQGFGRRRIHRASGDRRCRRANFYSLANLRDLAIGNAPVLIVAVGMTMVILTRQIDISVGSQFAACSVAAGLTAKMMAKTGMRSSQSSSRSR